MDVPFLQNGIWKTPDEQGYPPEVLAVTSRNQKACKRFTDARAAFLAEDFELALRYMEGYSQLVDYTSFFRHDGRPEGSKKLSVTIVAFHTGEELLACIESILSDGMPEKEVLIIDNGGNAEVLPVLLSLPVLYMKTPMNLFPSEGRNIGATSASSPIVIFLDDDAVATPSFCANAYAAFDVPSVLAVGGRAMAKKREGHGAAIAHAASGMEPRPARITLEGISAWRRKEYLEAGGMDPLLFGHEGEELSLRVLDFYPEGQLFYWPSMVVYHDLADSKSDHERKALRHKQMSRYFTWKRRRDLAMSGRG